jgi:protein O-GlcNAc transferase
MTDSLQNLLDKAVADLQRGKHEAAERNLRKALRDNPLSPEVHHYLGLVAYQKGQYDTATQHIKKSISLQASDPVTHHNVGLVLLARGMNEDALAAFKQAAALDPSYPQAWFGCGNAQRQLGNFEQARQDYAHAVSIDPFYADAYNNLGLTLRSLGDLEQSSQQLERCLEITPENHFALNNLGLTMQALGKHDKAQDLFTKAVELAPSYVEARVNLGNLLQLHGDYANACQQYDAAYRLAPEVDLLAGYLAQSKSMLCDWKDLGALWKRIEKKVDQGRLPCSPFDLLSFCDEPKRSLTLASKYADRHVKPPKVSTYAHPKKPHGKKLRIGYVSSDFREHPVAYLTVGILEAHDRDSVEVFGFALRAPQASGLGLRMRQSVDQFVDLSQLTDAQAVQSIREHDIDIAIDLNGYIEGCRPGIFKARVAPLQINFYGYPGTMGADFMDYIVGDSVLIPPDVRSLYSEKIIYLPDSYQPNDDKREISNKPISRSEHALPENVVVFCSFNKPYKITPAMFSCWMSILRETKDSVLWLQSTDELVVANLRREAKKAGVDEGRIVFAGRTPTTADHLARYRLADLFLDTYPYTAHTTANDALWAGLPVLGFSGRTFSARVSNSLLSSLGLADLVTHDFTAYKNKAIELANDPNQIAAYRERLELGKLESSLYKPAKITRWLEKGFYLAHERYVNKEAPEHIVVPRD